MIALGGPKLKPATGGVIGATVKVSMIALGGPKLKLEQGRMLMAAGSVSMIALGGPKLKPRSISAQTSSTRFQ